MGGKKAEWSVVVVASWSEKLFKPGFTNGAILLNEINLINVPYGGQTELSVGDLEGTSQHTVSLYSSP